MANIDYLVVMAKALHKSFETPLLVGSEDMQGAYRQLPLPDKQLGISITAVYDPTTKQPALFEIYGQPFGAGHSVPNFYRCAEWLCRLVVRSLSIMNRSFLRRFLLCVQSPRGVKLCLLYSAGLRHLRVQARSQKEPAPPGHFRSPGSFSKSSLVALAKTIVGRAKSISKS